ncbi:MAG: nitrile hydratase subunit alpha [Vulcanimicrobiaceae bacterium]
MTQAHSHGHDDHVHRPLTRYEKLERALRELLVENGLLTEVEIATEVDAMYARTPARGQQVIARAWFDPGFKARLLADGAAALRELGIDAGGLKLVVVENAPAVHNLIVCTLCSCYPVMLLGRSPDWYKSIAYRSRAVREPRTVLAEFGTHLPAGVTVRVHDSTADMRYMVLPMRPAGTEHLTEAECGALVSRDDMIGVTVPKSPPLASAVE